MAKTKQDQLEFWTRQICEKDMPLLSNTVQSVSKMTEDESAPLRVLANVILKDPGMTAHVLRVANSAFYGAKSREINTISRAVVVLGSNEIKNICLLSAVIGDFLKGKTKIRLLDEVALAFQAAVSARDIARKSHDAAPEEVFIAALLFRLGEMAVMSFAGDTFDKIERTMETKGVTQEEAELEVLGFHLHELTLSMSKKWNLGTLLEGTLTLEDESCASRVEGILLSYQFTEIVRAHGWSSPECELAVAEIAEYLDVAPAIAKSMLRSSAKQAAEVATSYGMAKAAERMAIAPKVGGEDEESGSQDGEAKEKRAQNESFGYRIFDRGDPQTLKMEQERSYRPDSVLQMRVLRDLSGLVQSNATASDAIQMVMEGIYRAICMDRVVFAAPNADRSYLQAKVVLGVEDSQFSSIFQFFLASRPENIFARVLQRGLYTWVKFPPPANLRPFITRDVTQILGEKGFFVGPLVVENKAVGVFYADRATSGKPLDNESFEAFEHFIMQGNNAFEEYSRRKRQ